MQLKQVSDGLPPDYLSSEGLEKCNQIVESLQNSGKVVLLVAPNAELAFFHLKNISKTLTQSRLDRVDPIRIAKLFKDRDSIIQAINRLLNQRAVNRVCTASAEKTQEIWVAESINRATLPEVIFAAKTLRKLPGSGASLIILANSENSKGIRDLLHSVKVDRYDFSQPVESEISLALQKSCSDDTRADILAIANKAGVSCLAEIKSTGPFIDGKTKRLSESETGKGFFSDEDVRLLIKSEKQKKAASDKEPKSWIKEAFKTFREIKSVGLVFFIMFLLLPIAIPKPDSKPEGRDFQQFENAKTPREPRRGDRNLPEKAALEQENSSKPINGARAFVASNSLPEDQITLNEADLKKLFDTDGNLLNQKVEERDSVYLESSTGVISNPSEDIENSRTDLVRELDQTKEAYFIQHAAFSQLEGAMVWRSNNNVSDSATGIYTKGDNPKRFVVLTGPFKERERAIKSIDKNSDAYVVPSRLIGNPIQMVTTSYELRRQ